MDEEMRKEILRIYEEADSIGSIFEAVKMTVKEVINRERGGLMLGLADLGTSNNYWIGAFWQLGSNVIIMNSVPLKRINDTNPDLMKPYNFHILLHEYLHSIGVLDELRTRELTYAISAEVFGEEHIITKLAKDISKFLPNITYPGVEWHPKDFKVTLIEGFDQGNTRYIG